MNIQNFPGRRCFHNCSDAGDIYPLGGKHPVCRNRINDPSVTCGYKIHDLILDILDHGVVPAKVSDDAFFNKNCQSLVFEILAKLESCYGGHPLEDIHRFKNQLGDVPDGFIDMLSLHTVIHSVNNLIFSKYFNQFVLGESLLEVYEVKAYLDVYLQSKFLSQKLLIFF